MEAITVDSTLTDIIDTVPRLLKDVASAVGVKVLRLVCKNLSRFALRAVRRFTIYMSPRVLDKKIFREAGALLQHAKLHHLIVDIDVEPTKGKLMYE